MPGEFISLKLDDVNFVRWVVGRVEGDVATWGMLNYDSRQRIKVAVSDLRVVLGQLGRFAGVSLEVLPSKVRALLALLERLTSAVHSARKVMTEDRRRALGLIAQARKRLLAYIQLNLFGASET
jgi:ribosomal 50S subunit-associated protein YjgA (DUF615 family)